MNSGSKHCTRPPATHRPALAEPAPTSASPPPTLPMPTPAQLHQVQLRVEIKQPPVETTRVLLANPPSSTRPARVSLTISFEKSTFVIFRDIFVPVRC